MARMVLLGSRRTKVGKTTRINSTSASPTGTSVSGRADVPDLIAELKARPEAYAKIPTYKTGNNAGEPNGSATIPVLKAALKAANGGKGVVVRKAGEVGSAAIPRFNRG